MSRCANLRKSLLTGKHQGFTLIEMTMVIVIMGVLGVVALYPMMTNTISAYQLTSKQVATNSQLRYAVERMAREIREVQEAAGSYTFITAVAASTNSIQFTKDDLITVTISGAALPNVTMQYSSPALTRTLTDQATALTFNYFQTDGVTAATGNNDVAIVQITLALQDPVSGMAQSQTTRVSLRN